MNQPYAILGQRLTLSGPSLGEDALWLAASIPPLPAHTKVLDAACGNAVAALALLTRQPQLNLTAVDIDPTLIQHATHNAQHNNLNLHTHTANLLTDKVLNAPFPHILCNPPFHGQQRGHQTSSPQKTQSKSLAPHALTSWLNALQNHLTANGTLHLILHTACEAELLAFAKTHTYTTIITPLQTAETKKPKRLLAHLTRSKTFFLTTTQPIPTYSKSLRTRILHNAEAL